MKLLLAAGVALAALSPVCGQLAAPNEAGIRMGHAHLNVRDVEGYRKIFV